MKGIHELVSASSLQKRIKSLTGVEPATMEEMERHRSESRRKFEAEIERTNGLQARLNLGANSGIKDLYLDCSFDNFYARTSEQRRTLALCKEYAASFDTKTARNFVFSGLPGSGKNHLACAIGNFLMDNGFKILVQSFGEIYQRRNAVFSENGTEHGFIAQLCSLDLLVIDEIGVIELTPKEGKFLFDVVNRRYEARKPTGMLTNMTEQQLSKEFSPALSDRMQANGGIFERFSWGSWRTQCQ